MNKKGIGLANNYKMKLKEKDYRSPYLVEYRDGALQYTNFEISIDEKNQMIDLQNNGFFSSLFWRFRKNFGFSECEFVSQYDVKLTHVTVLCTYIF